MYGATGDFTRRDLLRAAPTAALLLGTHELLAGCGPPPATAAGRAAAAQPAATNALLRALRLKTAAPLDRMRDFYRDRLGLPLLGESSTEISLAAGATRLTFVRAAKENIAGDAGRGAGEPMYHFAFNIPCNKILAARTWQLHRTPLVPPRPEVRDAAMPADVWDFAHWNAHSIFFFDPAWNIVEYIARHDLKNDAPDGERFSATDIECASEIGFVTDPPESTALARQIHAELGLAAYPPGSQPGWAMGDERGLLLCLARKGQLWGEESGTPVRWGEFPVEATIRGDRPRRLQLGGRAFWVNVEEA